MPDAAVLRWPTLGRQSVHDGAQTGSTCPQLNYPGRGLSLDRVLDEFAVGGLHAERRRSVGVAALVCLAGTAAAHSQLNHRPLISRDCAEHLPDELTRRCLLYTSPSPRDR